MGGMLQRLELKIFYEDFGVGIVMDNGKVLSVIMRVGIWR